MLNSSTRRWDGDGEPPMNAYERYEPYERYKLQLWTRGLHLQVTKVTRLKGAV